MSAKFTSLGNQVLLTRESTFELRNGGICAYRFLLRGAGETKVDDPHYRREREDGSESNLQPAIERERIARHFLCHCQRFKRRMRDLLPFFSNSRLCAEGRFSTLCAQLSSDSRQKLTRFERSRNRVVRAKVNRGCAFFGARTDQKNHAQRLGGHRSANRRQSFASIQVGHSRIQQKRIRPGRVYRVEAFLECAKRRRVVARTVHSGLQSVASRSIRFNYHDSFTCIRHGRGLREPGMLILAESQQTASLSLRSRQAHIRSSIITVLIYGTAIRNFGKSFKNK